MVWPGGENEFALAIGELRALEQRTGAGAFVVLTRLLASQWKVDDIVSTIRLGLIGGGMKESEAKQLLDNTLDTASYHSLVLTASRILEHALMWDAEDSPGELAAGEAK
ncbi:gene transfer agent family protein [Phyllobacterium sp. A18/5-2]|uniref:gene transfer agent family protein n=1 Tax=Phyllobacterium sp. A18/5-2 TaxID=2978392 RepID=UPI0021C65884|nr:gene transfer agent family protein [Phyllobacterium sp. A18/5-2]UXN62908.1 gene transfer agent family protein [Phyllobacterium sp. A18/5-2]